VFFDFRTAPCPISLCWAGGQGEQVAHLGKEERGCCRQTDGSKTIAPGIFHIHRLEEEEPTHTHTHTHTHKSIQPSPALQIWGRAGSMVTVTPAGREAVPGQPTAFPDSRALVA
jgi:hypothetical protein